MTNRNYTRPHVDPEWANSRETDMVVAVAIHAIADDSRSAEDIWEDPDYAEWDHVTMAVEEYLIHGDFERSDSGRYAWGCVTVEVSS